jgi:hypothetical protein
LEKLKEKFDIDLKKNYKQVSFIPNLLLLNKKVYLLYNYFNKKKEFLLLKNNKNSRYIFNFIGFFSLNFFLNIELNVKKFDYFKKWSSSLLQYNNGIIRNFIDDIHDIKRLVEPLRRLDYIISDNIFNNYNININNYFYLNRNNYVYNLFFKLSKKDDLKLKPFYLNHLLEYYLLLNDNYNNKLNICNWKNSIRWNFIFNLILKIKFHLIKEIKKNNFFYFFYKMKKNIFSSNLFKKNNKNFFLRNFLKNNKKIYFYFFKQYFQHLHFLKKLNKRFFGFKSRFKKKRSLDFFKEKFLPIIYIMLYKTLKRRNFLSFLKKNKKKNFIRNFYTFIYNFKFNDRIISKKDFLKKKKILRSYRIIKKLKTFYYIPDTGKTRKQVYKRFKRSVFWKFYKKKLRKKKRRVVGLHFNLSVYNHRNRYKHRMKMLALKKTITPRFHYLKKNNYKNINSRMVDINYKEVPFFVKRKYKLNIEKKKKRLFLKKKNWMKYKLFKKIKNQSVKKNKEEWINLYKERSGKLKKKNFFQYISFFKEKWNYHKKRNKRKYNQLWKDRTRSNNYAFVKKNNAFWFFQKILLYWKNLLKFKKKDNFINLNYINNCLNFLKKIYKQLFFLSVKFFHFCILKNWINNFSSISFFIKKKIYLLKIYMYIYFFLIEKINITYKNSKINRFRWLKKKRKKKWFFYFRKKLKLILLKKKGFYKNIKKNKNRGTNTIFNYKNLKNNKE